MIKYFNKTTAIFAAPIVVAAVALGLADNVKLGLVNEWTSLLLLMILAMAWNLVAGFGGQFSLGHSIFVGVGGYATAVILTYFQLPLFLVILMASLISATIGILLAFPLLRLRGPYLSIGSLGMALAATGFMLNWDFTKASQSYPLPSDALVDLAFLFKITVVVAALSLIAIISLVRSPLGLRLVALRDDENGAASLGVRRLRTLIPVWALSGLLTGVMGSLTAMQNGNLTPVSAFSLQFVLDAAIICVIGGLGTLSGPLLGAVLVFYLRQYSADFADWSILIEAVVVILVVRFFPGGITGLVSRAIVSLRVRFNNPPASLTTEAVKTIRKKQKR
ncbi:branched-chain amino acid transport system permease protein [Aurantimicrobium minutum]|uniref:branched-chain amino acid ABC transporter permease n=1 Tax=Aurantimicrobium minutum TaxID=708131 RepID=UPI002475B4F5|nr:branched-chain amino acid ABC transporter permease [Aurantimicrobium minutum]MDH6207105.1 branched-chain amino acid transport system permease protein [Aurantimicrobium minutum]MDH6424283.1 branched-chain amino acid transport system permease protein [Aurantimicrobium minutum]